MKEKIENEINKINQSYDTVNNEITNTYIIRHEKLVKEENALKEKLQNEVTKIKEKLENFLLECNQTIKICERINKGIKNLENENEKNMIKILSYVSKINKSDKEMNMLLQQLIKSENIKFDKEKNDIEFENYIFSGLPAPSNIEIKDITTDSFKILWKFDLNNIIDIKQNEIKYIIEIRKENEKFNQVYEGNSTDYLIKDLSDDTNYEIRICTLYNNMKSPWSQIQKTKTKICIFNFDKNSLIIGDNKDDIKYLKKWINPNKEIKGELLYRLSRDGSSYQTFHQYCDDKGPTLTLIKDENDMKTGGYTPLSWDSKTEWKNDNDTFIFNLTNKKKFPKPSNNNSCSIYCLNSYGPWFNNLGFEGGQNMKSCKFQTGTAFLNANEIIPNENQDKYFSVKEVEVYKLSFN